MTTQAQIDLIKQVVERNRAAGIAVVYPPDIPTLPSDSAIVLGMGSNGAGTESNMYRSADGINYTTPLVFPLAVSIPNTLNFKNYTLDYLDVGSGVIIALGDSVWRSIDNGLTWTKVYDPAIEDSSDDTFVYAQAELHCIAKGNGIIVAVGEHDDFTPGGLGTAIHSADSGATWSENIIDPVKNPLLFSVAFGNGLFVATGVPSSASTGLIYTSPDGITWTLRFTSSSSAGWLDILWNGSMFVAFGSTLQGTAWSTDGISWAENTSIGFTFGYGPSGGQYPGGLGDPYVLWSSSLNLWIAMATEIISPFTNCIITSPDGNTWTERFASTGVTITSGLALLTGKIYFGRGDGSIVSSTDGITWSIDNTTNVIGTQIISNLVVLGNLFVGYLTATDDSSAAFWSSPDTHTWTQRFIDTQRTTSENTVCVVS